MAEGYLEVFHAELSALPLGSLRKSPVANSPLLALVAPPTYDAKPVPLVGAFVPVPTLLGESGGTLLKVHVTIDSPDNVFLPRTIKQQRKITHLDRKSTRLNSSHANISYAVFCLKKKKK